MRYDSYLEIELSNLTYFNYFLCEFDFDAYFDSSFAETECFCEKNGD